MPIYEYRCLACRKPFSRLVGVLVQDDPLNCPHCGSSEVKQLISRFLRVRTEDQMMDDLADEIETVGEPDDPKTMRRFLREMSSAVDEDPHEFEAMWEEEMAREEGEEE